MIASKRPCFFCEKAGVACEPKRPCQRCVKSGFGSVCALQDGQARPKRDRPAESSTATSSSSPLSIDCSVSAPTAATAKSCKLSLAQHGNQSLSLAASPNAFARRNMPELFKNRALDDYQMYLLNELFKLKAEQSRLNREVDLLKTQNEELRKLHQDKALISSSNDIATVIFDLTKNPASVMTADKVFCDMIGCDMDEVLGSSWQKFVHPDYLERSIQILFGKAKTENVIEFEQIYKRSDGAIVYTFDTHTIFFNTEQKPVADYVTIRIKHILPSPQSNSHIPIAVPPPALTYPTYENTNANQSESPEQPSPSIKPMSPDAELTPSPLPSESPWQDELELNMMDTLPIEPSPLDSEILEIFGNPDA